MLLQLAKKFHPDTNKDDIDGEKKFQEVNRVYEVFFLEGFCYLS
jgi:curved DNA-binding protein CbpA